MKYDILLAGVGGQGVLSIAAIIAQAAMAEGLQVRQSEVHGMSQRGGGVQAHLRISDSEIYSDLIPKGGADMILSMEPLESLRYLEFLCPQGVLITSSVPFENITNYPDISELHKKIKKIPHSVLVDSKSIASVAGNLRSENMVFVGAALNHIPIQKKTVETAVCNRFGSKDPRLVDINCTALAMGTEVLA